MTQKQLPKYVEQKYPTFLTDFFLYHYYVIIMKVHERISIWPNIEICDDFKTDFLCNYAVIALINLLKSGYNWDNEITETENCVNSWLIQYSINQ